MRLILNRMKAKMSYLLPLLALAIGAQTTGAFTPSEWETGAAVTGGFDSMYLAEGRDDLGEGGLLYSEFAGEFGPTSFGVWFADGTEVDYNEVNLFAEVGFDLTETLSGYVGFTYLAFFEPDDNTEDSEVGFGFAYAPRDWIETTADYVYSFDAEGGFVELAVASPQSLAESLVVTPYALLGLDFGYRTEENDGLNHFQIGVDLEFAVTEFLSVGGYVAHAIALDDIDEEEKATGEDIGDNTAGGIFVTLSL